MNRHCLFEAHRHSARWVSVPDFFNFCSLLHFPSLFLDAIVSSYSLETLSPADFRCCSAAWSVPLIRFPSSPEAVDWHKVEA